MAGYLTTHVLDTARGCPAERLKIDLYRIEGGARVHLHSMETNTDGRTDRPILPEADFRQPEPRLFAADPQVAGQCQLASATQGEPGTGRASRIASGNTMLFA